MGTKLKDVTESPGFKSRKSYSPEDIWAAGGTTAFGKKTGQNNQKLVEALKSSPEIEPFTDEEWDEIMAYLNESK